MTANKVVSLPTGAVPDLRERVFICVCTCRRPKLLDACLNSLCELVVPEDVNVMVVVIDNDEAGSAEKLVQGYTEASPFLVLYYHEERRGIAFARNAALDVGIDLGADWIAMIDDDETADPFWLEAMMAPEYRDTHILVGANIPVYPTPRPFWAPDDEPVKGYEGQRLKTAYTGNVRFTLGVMGAGLRFNEQLGLMGGEDNEFFAAAHLEGFEIRRTLKAITWETVHPTRLTYRARIFRAYWCAASEMRRLALTRGFGRAMLRKAHTIPLNMVFGGFWLIVAAFAWPLSRAAFKDRAIHGGNKLAKAAGRAAALIGILPRPYLNIDGE